MGDAPRRVLVLHQQDRASRAMLKMLLELDGHDVSEACDGLSAVRMLEVDGCRPEIVIVDITLPDIDGYEVARRIRQLGSTARLLALTGHGRPEDIARSRDAGFDLHLIKPLDPDQLTSIISAG